MTSGNGDAIFADRKGHADRSLLDLGSLVWVGALYDVDLTDYPLGIEYEADLISIAETILGEDDHIR
jgi:flagellar biosynthesis regulator FlaF